MWVLWLIVSAASAELIKAQAGITAIEQVAVMLNEIRTTSATSLEKETSDYGRLDAFCIATTATTDEELTLSKDEAVAATAQTALLEVEVQELSTAIATGDAELMEIEQTRISEKGAHDDALSEYHAALAEYDAGIKAVERAVEVMKIQQVQMAQAQMADSDSLELVSKKHIIKAIAPLKEHKKVMNLLQKQTPWAADEHMMDDLDTTALNKQYSGQSGGIVETLLSVSDSLTTERDELYNTEATRKTNYIATEATLTEQATTSRTSYDANVASRVEKEGLLEEAVTTEAAVKEAVASTTAFLAEHEASCTAELKASAEKKTMLAGEVEAIDKATTALTGVAQLGLLRINSKISKGLPLDEKQEDERVADVEKLGSFLRMEARKISSQSLSHLADKAFELAAQEPTEDESLGERMQDDTDPLAEVKAMIESLIVDMKQQEIDETEHKAYCDEELAKNTFNTNSANAGIEKHSSTLLAYQGELGSVITDVNDTTLELADRIDARANATALRTDMKNSSETTIKQGQDAMSAVSAAVEILTAFYSNETMFPDRPVSADNILAMLEVVHDDFKGTVDRTTTLEEEAAAEFVKIDTEGRVSIASLQKDLEAAKVRQSQLEAAIPTTQTDLNTSNDMLNSSEVMYDKLYPLCLEPESYEDKKAQREQEITALTESLEMFDSMAVGAFLQGSKVHKKNATKVANKTIAVAQTKVEKTPIELKAAVKALFGTIAMTVVRVNRTLVAGRQDPGYSDAIERVISILETVQTDVQADVAADDATYAEMQGWCTENLASAKAFNSDGQDRDEQLTLLIESTTANVAANEINVKHLKEEIETAQNALATASTLREKEHTSYQEESKKLIVSVTALQGALVVLSNHQVNGGGADAGNGTTRSIEEVEGDYQETLGLSIVSKNVKKVFKEFPGAVSAVEQSTVLRALAENRQPALNRPGDDATAEDGATYTTSEDGTVTQDSPTGEWREAPESVTQPKGQSGAVFGILTEMLEQFQQDLLDEQTKDEEASALFEALKETKTAEINAFTASATTKSAELATGQLTVASSKEELEDLRASLSSGYELVQTVTLQCNDFDNSYAARNATRHSELAALEDTITKLSSPDAAAIFGGESTTPAPPGVTRPDRVLAHAATEQSKVAVPAAPTTPPTPQDVLSHFMLKYGRNQPAPAATPVVSSTSATTAPVAKAAAPVAKEVVKTEAPAATPAAAPVANATATPVVQAVQKVAVPIRRAHADTMWTEGIHIPSKDSKESAKAASLVQQSQTPGLTADVLQVVVDQIDPLVAVLMQEKLIESQTRDMCMSEINNADLRIEQYNTTYQELDRQWVRQNISVTVATGQIEAATTEFAAMKSALNVSSTERTRQHAEFSGEVKAQQEVAELLGDAMQTMRNFYGSQSFIQQKPATNNSWEDTPPEFKEMSSHGSSGGIVKILEMLYEEANAMIAHVVDAEESAMDAHASEVNTMTNAIAMKEREIVTLEATHGQAVLMRSELQTQKEATTAEMHLAQTYLINCHAKCDLLLQYFTNNQEHRTSEIKALRDAKAFLRGQVTSGVFLQRK